MKIKKVKVILLSKLLLYNIKIYYFHNIIYIILNHSFQYNIIL